jgi:hypothetical protein
MFVKSLLKRTHDGLDNSAATIIFAGYGRVWRRLGSA